MLQGKHRNWWWRKCLETFFQYVLFLRFIWDFGCYCYDNLVSPELILHLDFFPSFSFLFLLCFPDVVLSSEHDLLSLSSLNSLLSSLFPRLSSTCDPKSISKSTWTWRKPEVLHISSLFCVAALVTSKGIILGLEISPCINEDSWF